MNDVSRDDLRVRQGSTHAPDAAGAVAALKAAIWQPDIRVVVVFASTTYDPQSLNAALAAAFPNTLVIGCSGAGEIGPGGLISRGLVGTSIAGDDLWVSARAIAPLRDFEPDVAVAASLALRDEATAAGFEVCAERCFALLLVDGTSATEEQLLSAVTEGLGSVPLVGGSAGDDVGLGATFVLADGQVLAEGAVLALFHTTRPFRCFKHQNYRSSAEPMVVTDASPRTRIVREINGLPAAEEYARLHGITVDLSDPDGLMLYPCAFRVGDQLYLRAVLEVLPDNSIRFGAAVDVGVILYAATPLPIAASLSECLTEASRAVGGAALTLGMDCVCRWRANEAAGIEREVTAAFQAARTIGFASYGEQFNSLQVNMTLTAVMIGGGE